jgi:hypothetical protein
MDREDDDARRSAEQRHVQLYTRGLNKTLGTPHKRHVRRLAIQRASQRAREISP